MKWYEYLLFPFWIIEEIVSSVYWYFKLKNPKNRDTSNSIADDSIEARYFI